MCERFLRAQFCPREQTNRRKYLGCIARITLAAGNMKNNTLALKKSSQQWISPGTAYQLQQFVANNSLCILREFQSQEDLQLQTTYIREWACFVVLTTNLRKDAAEGKKVNLVKQY